VEENAVFIDFAPEALLSKISNFKDLNIYERTALAKNIPSAREALLDYTQVFTNFLSKLVFIS
jgi:hypothetical protein